MTDLSALTLKQASAMIRAKKVSPVELTEACLASIKTFNPKTNAWITVMREQALAQAHALEKEQAAGHFRSPLHGIPIGLKDNIDAAGVRTTAGSKTLEGNVPLNDAEVTRRLRAPAQSLSASATCTSSLREPLLPSVILALCATPGTWPPSPADHPVGLPLP